MRRETPDNESMLLLLLKVLLAPVLVLSASVAQRRWGPAVGGRLVGLPLTAAPLLVLLAVSNGPLFTSHVAIGDQAGDVAATAWCVAYVVASRRMRPLGAFVAASAAFGAVALVLSQISTNALMATVLAAAALIAALVWWPKASAPATLPLRGGNDLALRMLVAAAFTFGLSESAASVGARSAGLIGALPLVTIVLTVATHYRQGPGHVEAFLHGVMSGSFSVIAFLAILAVALPTLGIVPAFTLGFAAAVGSQFVTGRRLSGGSATNSWEAEHRAPAPTGRLSAGV
jgi:hypothetical protein